MKFRQVRECLKAPSALRFRTFKCPSSASCVQVFFKYFKCLNALFPYVSSAPQVLLKCLSALQVSKGPCGLSVYCNSETQLP